MRALRNFVALWCLAIAIAVAPAQQARSVVAVAPLDGASPSRVADLAAAFGLTASPVIDDALNRWVNGARAEWTKRRPVQNSFTHRQIRAWTPVFQDLHYRISLAINAPPLSDQSDPPADCCATQF